MAIIFWGISQSTGSFRLQMALMVGNQVLCQVTDRSQSTPFPVGGGGGVINFASTYISEHFRTKTVVY